MGFNFSSCYEGDRLSRLLQLIHREIESTKDLDKNLLPEKIWIKQQFAIGVNEVTRTLERMKPRTEVGICPKLPELHNSNHTRPSIPLQVILVANDCNPKWLTKHLPSLASSRKVPLIYIKDNKEGSLRLGRLVKLKTAIAIGVKAKENGINKLFEEILQGNEIEPCEEIPYP